MRRAIFVLILFNIISVYCLSQTRVRDSLLNLLNNHPEEDTTRVVLLMRLADFYKSNNPDTAIYLTDEAIPIAKKLNFLRRLINIYFIRGFSFSTKGQFEKGLGIQMQALDLAYQIGAAVPIVKVINQIAGDYTHLSNYSEALNYLNKGLEIAQKANYKSGLAALTGNMANVYTLLQDYDKGLEYAFQSLHLHQGLDEINQVALINNNIASMYIKKKNYQQSMAHNLTALKIYDSIGLRKGIASSYLGLGIAYNRTKRYSLAIDCLKKSLAIYDSLDAVDNAATSLTDLAIVFNEAPDSVLKNNKVDPSDRFKVAHQYAVMGLANSKKTKNLDGLSDNWKTLSDIYENHHDFDSALYAYKQYFEIYDSIAGDKKRQDIAMQSVRIEAEKREAVMNANHEASLNREKIIKNSILAGAGILFVSGLSVFIFYKRKRDATEKQKEAELNAAISDTEMKALRAQMNPHFIFNSLNSIRDYFAKNETAVADEYLTKFARLMRLVLENSEKKLVRLSDDLRALELYMQLEALRLNKKFQYEVTVDGQIDPETTLVPPLILQPFVENSIWHGIAAKNGNGNIAIQIKKEDGMINCSVEDNGVGRKNAANVLELRDSSGKRSLGMRITSERIKLINTLKNANASVHLYDLQQGTRVEVKLPLELTF